MLGRVVSRTLTTFGLLAASLAWAGWVYQHTAGDPHRVESVVTEVLHDPRARFEVATGISKQLVDATGVSSIDRTTIAGAIDDTLADDRIATNLVAAVASEHAHAIGIDDPRPTTIDTPALVASAKEHLSQISPELAALLPDTPVQPVTLPHFRPPGASAIRSAARNGTVALAALAVALLGLALALGDRRRTLARYGTWAIASGLGWIVVPYGIGALAKHFAPDYQNVISIVVHVWTRSIVPAAIGLVVSGAVAVVLMLVPGLAPRADEVDTRRTARPAYQPSPAATGYVAAQPAPATATMSAMASTAAHPPAAPGPRPPAAPHDTFVRSAGDPLWSATVGQAPMAPVGATPVGATPAAAMTGPADNFLTGSVTAQPPAPPEIDPWAHFFPDAPRPQP